MQKKDTSFLPMSVDNIGFLVDRLGQDCHPLQFLRELTQNSIEAIQRRGGKGEIVWDMDWPSYQLEGIKKLCITDNGDGMTGKELINFINQLSSSASTQSMDGNYGVGAKIAAATRNPHGVIFLSWKGNEGAMIQLFRSKTGQYGLMQWELLDKSYRHFKPVEDDVKPELIKANGTKVVLLGNSKEDNTMLAPVEAQSPSRWISKFLNTRYFKFPDGIIVKAREGWDYDPNDSHNNYLRHITGQGPYLKHHASYSGTLKLSNAVAHWWILKEDKALTSSGGHLESVGHVAALYQNELKILREITSYGNLWRLTKFNLGIISTCSV